MDATTHSQETHQHDEHEHGHEHHELGFWRKYVFSTDHKVIGIWYGISGLIFLLFGFSLMMMMRWQLAYPGTALPVIGKALGTIFGPGSMPDGKMTPEFYNSLGAMHGTIMIFAGIVPLAFAAFGNFVVPLQIGAPDMTFPKVNAASYWAFFVGCVIMLVSFFVPGGAFFFESFFADFSSSASSGSASSAASSSAVSAVSTVSVSAAGAAVSAAGIAALSPPSLSSSPTGRSRLVTARCAAERPSRCGTHAFVAITILSRGTVLMARPMTDSVPYTAAVIDRAGRVHMVSEATREPESKVWFLTDHRGTRIVHNVIGKVMTSSLELADALFHPPVG